MKVVQHHTRTTMKRRAVTSCGFVVFCPLSLPPPDFLLVCVANSTAIAAVAAAVLFFFFSLLFFSFCVLLPASLEPYKVGKGTCTPRSEIETGVMVWPTRDLPLDRLLPLTRVNLRVFHEVL